MAGRPGRTPSPAAPARKGKAAPARPAPKPTLIGRVFARPGMIVAGASFAAVMTGIVANALVLQRGHHPSPLFNPPAVEAPAAVPLPPPAPRQALAQPVAAPEPAPLAAAPAVDEAPAAALPVPIPRPAAHIVKKPVIHPAAVAHKDAAAPPHKAVAPAHKDPIAQLIGAAR